MEQTDIPISDNKNIAKRIFQQIKPRLTWILLIQILGVFAAYLIGNLIIDQFGRTKPPIFKLWIAGITMEIIFLGWLVDLYKKRTWAKIARIVITVMIGALVLATIFVENHRKTDGITGVRNIHAWNQYHYVLGTKYFDELGYFNLYKATVLADLEFKRSRIRGKRVRDMDTYTTITREEATRRAKAEKVKDRFSKKRWRFFKKDLKTMLKFQGRKTWGKVIHDLGYNPSPAFHIIHKPLLSKAKLTDPKTYKSLASVQTYLFIITFLISWWAFGMRATLIMTLWVNLYFGNAGRLVGGYFSYDWFCVMVWAAALVKKGHLVSGAGVLSYTAMMRGFPGLMAIPFALKWVKGLFYIKNEGENAGFFKKIGLRFPDKKYTRFCAALVLFCMLVVVLGGFSSSHGIKAWSEWKEKISRHSDYHVLASIRVGLHLIFSHDYNKGSWSEPKEERGRNLERNKIFFRIVQLMLIFMALAAMMRRSDYDGMLLGLIVAFAAMVTSRYYFTGWVLLFTFSAMDKHRIGNLISSLWMFALIVLNYYLALKGGHGRMLWITFNIGLTLYFFALVSYLLIMDLIWLKKNRAKSSSDLYNQQEDVSDFEKPVSQES